MSDPVFTPGPWKATNGIVKAISHGRWFTICRIDKPRFSPEGIEGNARLISASPDLLDALKTLVGCDNCNYERDTMRSAGYFDKARAAIAKAEGR